MYASGVHLRDVRIRSALEGCTHQECTGGMYASGVHLRDVRIRSALEGCTHQECT